MAAYVRERFLQARNVETEVSLIVDGQPVPLNAFATAVIANTLRGLVKGFRGVPAKPSCVTVEVRGNPDG